MGTPRLYCPELAKGRLTLLPSEWHHAVHVRHAREGETVELFDGEGHVATGRIASLGRDALQVDVAGITKRPFELNCRITLAVAVPRTHRQGVLVEKCTELGVAAIWPTVTERCVAKPKADVVHKWSRRAIEAAKQSGRAWVPNVCPPTRFDAVVARIGEFDASALAHRCDEAVPLAEFLTSHTQATSLLVFIGPEGGLTHAETHAAIARGAEPISLGPTVLRIETAAMAVCAAVAARTRS